MGKCPILAEQRVKYFFEENEVMPILDGRSGNQWNTLHKFAYEAICCRKLIVDKFNFLANT